MSPLIWREMRYPAIHRTIIEPPIVNSSKGIVSPLTRAKKSHRNAGGQGVLHCTEACGMKGVNSTAITKDQKKMRAADGLTRRHRRQVTATMIRPSRVQSPDATMRRFMGLVEWQRLAAVHSLDSRDFQRP